MSAKIVFFVTESQADFLLTYQANKPNHWRYTRERDALRARGFLAGTYSDTKITPLGRQAIKLLRMIRAREAARSPG